MEITLLDQKREIIIVCIQFRKGRELFEGESTQVFLQKESAYDQILNTQGPLYRAKVTIVYNICKVQ